MMRLPSNIEKYGKGLYAGQINKVKMRGSTAQMSKELFVEFARDFFINL
jgi:hypothetical protein